MSNNILNIIFSLIQFKDTTTICKNWGKSGILELCDSIGPQGERTFHICPNGRCASKIQFLRKLNRESYL